MSESEVSGRRASWGQAASEVLLILAVFFIAAGEPVPHVNEQHYLSRLKHFWDPSWCPHDFFLGTPDAHFTIVWLGGWVTKFLPLSVVAWGSRLLVWGLLAWAWRRLSWAVTPTRWCAVLSAALWIVGIQQGNLAGEWVVGGVEAKCFAYVFVLLALGAFVEDRWNAAWVHLGLASAFHVLVGGWSVLILFALWLGTSDRPTLRSMAPALVIGGVIALAGLLPPILMNRSAPAEVVAQANCIYVFDRLPHHLALLSKEDVWIAERTGRHLVVLALLAWGTWWAGAQRSGKEDDFSEQRRRLLRLCRFAWGAATLMLVGFAIELVASGSPTDAAKWLRFYWYRLTDVAAPLVVALTITAAIACGIRRKRTLALAELVAAIALVTASLGPVTWERWQDPRAPADKQITNLPAWEQVCDWIANNTPPDALFLVPRHANSFRWRTSRGEVFNYKDIPQNATGIVEWKHRLDDIYRQTNEAGELVNMRSLAHHGAEGLSELASKYGADFVLTTTRKPVSLPVAYRNRTYVVYDLREARTGQLDSNETTGE